MGETSDSFSVMFVTNATHLSERQIQNEINPFSSQKWYQDRLFNDSENDFNGSCCLDNGIPKDMKFNDSHVITISAYSFLMVISAIGNISVLRALAKPRVRAASSRVSFILLHLAIADLFVTFLLMPLEIGWAWTVSWKAGDFGCRFMAFFRTFGIYLSGFLLIVISVDRYHSVLRPLTVIEAKRRVVKMLWVAWISSILCSLPQAVIFHVERHPDFPWFEQCVTFNSFPTPEFELAYSVSGFLAMYAIPLLAIIYCYGSIVIALYRKLGDRMTPSMDRTKTKTLYMTLIIVLAFFFCWTPYNIMSLWYFFDRKSAQTVDRRIQALLFIFAVANSTVNPLVYGYFNCRRCNCNADLSRQHLRMQKIVFKSQFRQHLCGCNSNWSSSSDQRLGSRNDRHLYRSNLPLGRITHDTVPNGPTLPERGVYYSRNHHSSPVYPPGSGARMVIQYRHSNSYPNHPQHSKLEIDSNSSQEINNFEGREKTHLGTLEI